MTLIYFINKQIKCYCNTGLTCFILLLIFLYSTLSYSQSHYLLCGPDEDGCFKDIYQYCACIPFNNEEGNKPYCFDFDAFLCAPLSETPNCDPGLVFKDQASCLAVSFQSEPSPPCKLVTKSFCLKHHTPICAANGDRLSCR